MINAAALFNAVPSFSEGTDSSSASARAGASAADAFAALLAELDPADLQAALSAPAAAPNRALPEDKKAAPQESEGTAPFPVQFPVLLEARPAGSWRTAEQKPGPAVRDDDEEASSEETVIDPTAFLTAPILMPIVDRTSVVPLSFGTVTTMPEDESATPAPPAPPATPATLATLATLPTGTWSHAPAGPIPATAFVRAMVEPLAAAAEELAEEETQAPPSTSALPSKAIDMAPVPQGRAIPEEGDRPALPASGFLDVPEESPETGKRIAERPPLDLRPAATVASRPAPSAQADLRAPVTGSEQLIPRDSDGASAPSAPSSVEGKWVQAVKRFIALPEAAADAPADARGLSMFAAMDRSTLAEGTRIDLRGAEQRLAALTQAFEGANANSDHQASQRGTAGPLVVHSTHVASGASSAVEFAVTANTNDAPLPEDAELARQIVQAARLQWRNGGGEARLTLQPEYLGEVQISIRVESGTVTATMHAAEPQVRAWMQTHESLLKQGLAEQGLQLDKLNVHDEREERDPAQDRNRDPREQPRPPQPRPGSYPVFELNL